MKYRKKSWQEEDKIKLWVLYDAGVPAIKIATNFGCSQSAIEKAIWRFNLKKSSYPKRYSKNFTAQTVKKLSLSVLKNASLGHVEDNINWDKMPRKKVPWQTGLKKKVFFPKDSARSLRDKNLKEVTFHSEETIFNELKNYGFPAYLYMKKCTQRQEPLYSVDNKVMTYAQLIVLVNKNRLAKGLKRPLYFDGHTT